MARLYSNENFNLAVVDILRALNHDVLTTKDAGKHNQGIPDEEVLVFANTENRTVITFNYQHFKRLHKLYAKHSGIIICTEDKDLAALAHRIHHAIEATGGHLDNQLIRINRPNPSQKAA